MDLSNIMMLRKDLETTLTKAVSDFEIQTGCSVASIDNHVVQAIGCKPKTVNVIVKVQLP